MKNGKYELIIPPANYPGPKYRDRYAYEHIVNWWIHKKEVPRKGWEIHHKDGNHRNNNIKNLQLVTMGEHRKLHGKLRTKKHTGVVICYHCGAKFSLLLSRIKWRLKQNEGRIYCSRSCQISLQQKILRKKSF